MHSIGPPVKLVKNLLFSDENIFSLSLNNSNIPWGLCEPSSPVKLKNFKLNKAFCLVRPGLNLHRLNKPVCQALNWADLKAQILQLELVLRCWKARALKRKWKLSTAQTRGFFISAKKILKGNADRRTTNCFWIIEIVGWKKSVKFFTTS